jgi:hypothetical protein
MADIKGLERTRKLAREGRSFRLSNCTRAGCGHSPDWHRLDDASNISPTDPAAMYRCYGYDVEAPGPSHEPGELCQCPDYIGDHLVGV